MDFIPFTIIDFIDIVLVASIVFGLYRMSRDTNAPYILTGIVVIYVLWVVVQALNMELLQAILGQVINVGVIAIIILFQPELRHFLQMIGRRQGGFNFINRIFNSRSDNEPALQPIITACAEMSATKTGALIVIAQRSDLSDIIAGGITVDARLSVALLENIFFKNSPLHDGAMIIVDGKIVAAGAILPVSKNPNIPRHLGLRHRAAMGISEKSDALVIIVSEETGKISIAVGGTLNYNLSLDDARMILIEELRPKKEVLLDEEFEEEDHNEGA